MMWCMRVVRDYLGSRNPRSEQHGFTGLKSQRLSHHPSRQPRKNLSCPKTVSQTLHSGLYPIDHIGGTVALEVTYHVFKNSHHEHFGHEIA
jgi:hypothetical protein